LRLRSQPHKAVLLLTLKGLNFSALFVSDIAQLSPQRLLDSPAALA